MKLLANENIPSDAVRRLRAMGHDVLSITETCRGITDAEVLALAHDQQRILLTFDRDYGELIYVKRLPSPAGLIYLRFIPATPSEPADAMAALLNDSNSPALGGFLVLDREGYRRRPLPEAAT